MIDLLEISPATPPSIWSSLLNQLERLTAAQQLITIRNDLIINHPHALEDRPHTSLCLAKTYVIPAGMYGSQVWGTGFLQAGREFSSPLSTLHLHFLKGTLGVKQSTTNWAVLRECGHEPLQFYWFPSTVKLFNSMLNTNSDTCKG